MSVLFILVWGRVGGVKDGHESAYGGQVGTKYEASGQGGQRQSGDFGPRSATPEADKRRGYNCGARRGGTVEGGYNLQNEANGFGVLDDLDQLGGQMLRNYNATVCQLASFGFVRPKRSQFEGEMKSKLRLETMEKPIEERLDGSRALHELLA